MIINGMNLTLAAKINLNSIWKSIRQTPVLLSFLAGLLVPCGFAPFNMPGLSIIGLALLFTQLQRQTLKQSFYKGFTFGLGFFGLGVSWIYVSIYNYGHLNAILSALITLLFIAYLALYPAGVAMLYQRLSLKHVTLFNSILFSALWCIGEWVRATFLSGFPWLILGVGQINTPLKYLLPIIGAFGVSFIVCFIATCVATGLQKNNIRRNPWIMACIALLITPLLLKNHQWTSVSSTPISVGVIQANLSMRDKWNEALFWQLVQRYETYTRQLIGRKDLIVMPESAIPVPINYVSDLLESLDQQASKAGSAIILGIPEPTIADDTAYYNTLTTLGVAQGSYLKQHLVPFGEFIPKPFQQLTTWLNVPAANMKPGGSSQALVQVQHHSIASLICYELAYPNLLRKQLPQAVWIVSISDDGWFGHSLAMHQQLQMAQVLSLQTGRFQIVANNDGLSSIVNNLGEITSSLPAFQSGVLEATIYPASGSTPWVVIGDTPILLLNVLIVLLALLVRVKGYNRQTYGFAPTA